MVSCKVFFLWVEYVEVGLKPIESQQQRTMLLMTTKTTKERTTKRRSTTTMKLSMTKKRAAQADVASYAFA